MSSTSLKRSVVRVSRLTFTARRYASAVYAVRPSVRPSVRHKLLW